MGSLKAMVVALLVGAACAGPGLRQPPAESDEGIAALVGRRLAADQKLCPFEVGVVVYRGKARLTGKVGSDADKRRAEEIARDAGAREVDDELTVDPSSADPAKC